MNNVTLFLLKTQIFFLYLYQISWIACTKSFSKQMLLHIFAVKEWIFLYASAVDFY